MATSVLLLAVIVSCFQVKEFNLLNLNGNLMQNQGYRLSSMSFSETTKIICQHSVNWLYFKQGRSVFTARYVSNIEI